MNKAILFAAIAILSGLLLASPAQAQFSAGVQTIGPSVGLSFLGSSPQFGVNYENGFSSESYGTWGWGLLGRYWSYSDDWYWGKWTYTNILIGGTVALHFKVGDGKFDPAVGILLGYDIVSSSTTYNSGYAGYNYGSGSASFFTATFYGHLRYWFTPNVAG